MRIVLPVVGLLMLLAGVPAFEVVRVVAILLVQITAGVLIWGVVDPRSSKSMPLMIGAGSTIGFCASTLLHQLLLTTPIARIAWLLPLIGVLVFLFFKRKQNDFEATSELQFGLKTFAPILVLFTTIGLGDQWWWIYPIVFLSGALVIANFLQKNIYKVVFILTPFALLFGVLLRKVNYLWWIITNDIPYLESLAYSVNRWGSQRNITASGTGLSYHWFALAWSGMTTQLSGAQSWTVLTIMLPIVVCMTIGLLVWGMIYEATTSSVLATIGAASVLLLRDVVSVTSPTHMFSFTIMFVLVLMMKRWLETHTITFHAAVTAALLLFCLFGSKVSTGATFMVGIGLTLLLALKIKWKSKILLLVGSGFVICVSYIFFFGTGPHGGGHQLKLRFSNAGGLLIADRGLGGGNLHFALEIYAQTLYFLPMLGGVFLLYSLKKVLRISNFENYLSLTIIGGFTLARILDGGGTESYFMHVTFPLAIILVIILVNRTYSLLDLGFSSNRLALIIGIGIMLGFIRHWASQVIISNQSYSIYLRSLPYLAVDFTIIAISALVTLRFKHSVFRTSFMFLFCLLITSSICGEQIHRRFNFAKSALAASSGSGPEFVKWNHLAGSSNQRDAMSWIRENTPSDDLIATNRRCLQSDFCGFPKWYLVSALAHRQILLESNSTGLSDENPLVDERRALSENFASHPTAEMAKRLYELGVRWHYVELDYIETAKGWEPLDLAQKRTWEPWAKIVFKNDTSVVLKLLPPAN
jgi:hypothetical protein